MTQSEKKVLWMDDQYIELIDYSSRLSRLNYLVDPVKSVSEVMQKLKEEEYAAYIFDLKVLPGGDPYWQSLDKLKRKDNPLFDPYLGFELLRFLHEAREEGSELWRKIKFDFGKVIVFSVVNDNDVYDKLESFGIPTHQIVYKSGSDLDTLKELVGEMQSEIVEDEST